MNPATALETVHCIALRHGFIAQARLVQHLLAQVTSEPAGIWDALNTNDVRGGAGSLVEIT